MKVTLMISKLKPFMAYLEYQQYGRLKAFSAKTKIPMTQIIREAIEARISSGDRYQTGYNSAISHAIEAVKNNKAAKMRFPSGKSFADLVIEDLQPLTLKANHETETVTESPIAGRHEEGSGSADGGDPSLGI